MFKFFIIYNLIFCTALLVNFIIIHTGYNKFGLHSNKYWQRYHHLFDIVDILYNYHLSVFFLEWPHTPFETISDRIRRYLTLKDNSLKHKIASFFASILNKYDKDHC